jgi:hypothetical protein
MEVLRLHEGLLEMSSIINSAYIKQNFNTTVISGINYFPFKINVKEIVEKAD